MKKLRVSFSLAIAIFYFALLSFGEISSFDHSDYDNFLRRNVRDGVLDYESARQDRFLLTGYLDKVARISKERFEAMSREEKMAFLINACNAITIQSILEHYPIQNVRDVMEGKDKKISVHGNLVSRGELENELRQRFRDERVFAALYRASKGGPLIRPEAYSARNLDRLLDEDVRRFVNDSDRNRIKPGKRKVFLSELFRWYGEDFILNFGVVTDSSHKNQQESAVLSFIAYYLEDSPKRDFIENGRYKVKYLPYDWTFLDSQPTDSYPRG